MGGVHLSSRELVTVRRLTGTCSAHRRRRYETIRLWAWGLRFILGCVPRSRWRIAKNHVPRRSSPTSWAAPARCADRLFVGSHHLQETTAYASPSGPSACCSPRSKRQAAARPRLYQLSSPPSAKRFAERIPQTALRESQVLFHFDLTRSTDVGLVLRLIEDVSIVDLMTVTHVGLREQILIEMNLERGEGPIH